MLAIVKNINSSIKSMMNANDFIHYESVGWWRKLVEEKVVKEDGHRIGERQFPTFA